MASTPIAAANANTFPSSYTDTAKSRLPTANTPATGHILHTLLSTLTNWRNDPHLKDQFDKSSG